MACRPKPCRQLVGAGCGVVFLTSSGRSNFSGTSQVFTVLCVSALSTVASSLRDRFPALISVESAARSYPATAAQHNARSFAISHGKAGRDWPCGEVESSGNVPANSSQRASRADYLPGSSPAWPGVFRTSGRLLKATGGLVFIRRNYLALPAAPASRTPLCGCCVTASHATSCSTRSVAAPHSGFWAFAKISGIGSPTGLRR